jgi:hypothetical protein
VAGAPDGATITVTVAATVRRSRTAGDRAAAERKAARGSGSRGHPAAFGRHSALRRRHCLQADGRGRQGLSDSRHQRRHGGPRVVRGDRLGQCARHDGRHQGARRSANLRPQLQQPHDGQHRAVGAARPFHLPVPPPEGGHRRHLRSVGSVRRESRSLRHECLRRGGGLDGRGRQGLPGTFRRRSVAVLGQGKVLLRAIPTAREPGRGHCAVGRAQDRSEPGEQSTGTGWRDRPAGYVRDWMRRASGCRSSARTTPPRIATTFGSSSCSRTRSTASGTGSPMPNNSTMSARRRIAWRITSRRTQSRASEHSAHRSTSLVAPRTGSDLPGWRRHRCAVGRQPSRSLCVREQQPRRCRALRYDRNAWPTR